MQFYIPCNDRSVLDKFLSEYAKQYGIQIDILEEEDRDGTMFFHVSSTGLDPNKVFEMGSNYARFIRVLRERGEIDW